MQREMEKSKEPDKRMAAVCGLFCEACSWFISTTEDPERLKRLAAQQNWSTEEGTEEFSNIHGVQQIRYSRGNIRETFGDVLATLSKEFGKRR